MNGTLTSLVETVVKLTKSLGIPTNDIFLTFIWPPERLNFD